MRRAGYVVASALVAVATAAAKEIPPGALHVCGAKHCRAVKDPGQTRAFNSLLWGLGRVVRAPTPRVGSPVYQLRYPEGPVGAIINATSIRVAGLNCGRFQRGKWYRLPKALRGVTTGLEPRRLRAYVPPSC
jgi:hypothetical protein